MSGNAPPTFAEAVRRRAWARLLPALGPRRVAVLAEGTAPPEETGAPPPVVVVRVGAGRVPGDVVGAAERLPVQSESVTGVVFHGTDPSPAALREAARVLQPGGCVAVTGTGTGAAVRELDSVARGAGLTPVARRAVLRPAAVAGRTPGGWFAAMAERGELRAAARAGDDETVEWTFVARLPGGAETEMPEFRGILASMFVPARWRRRPDAPSEPAERPRA